MGTLTLTKVRQTLRDSYNEQSQSRLTDAELDRIIGRGYIDVAVKALCCEQLVQKTNIAATRTVIPLIADGIIQVTHVAYKTLISGQPIGQPRVLPPTVGWSNISGTTPQGWFLWGDALVVDLPVMTGEYHLDIYAAHYPTTQVGRDIVAGAFVPGTTYVIKSLGTTNFQAIGAPSNATDVEFVATGAGTGTGVAMPISFGDLPVEMHECVLDFAMAYAAIKLRRWADCALAYNRYIGAIQRKRWEYMFRIPDVRAARAIPDNVQMEARS